MAEVVRIQLRRGTATQWETENPTLGEAEFGIETDTGKFKVGDGITAWNDIANYFQPVIRDSESQWTETNPVLGEAEFGVDTTNGKFKIGDGETAWDDLDYFQPVNLADYVTNATLTTTLSNYLTTSTAAETYLTEQAANSLYALLSGATFTGDVILNADPTQNLGAATKQYVDNVAIGLQTKPAVKAATTTNLSGTYDNGTDGVGSTLNLGQLATLDIDGVTTWQQYDGILLKDQTAAAENGRWVMDQIGNDTDTDWILRRCGLCDDPSEIPGAYMFVSDGDTNVGSGWVLTVEDAATFVVGTDDITANEFTSSTAYTAGNGLTLSTNEFAIDSSVVTTLTGTQTLTNKTVNLGLIKTPIIGTPVETMTVRDPGQSPNIYPMNIGNSSVDYFSAGNTSSIFVFYADFGVTPNQSVVTHTVIVNQGSTPRAAGTSGRYLVQPVGGSSTAVDVDWLNSTEPTPEANTTSVYTFSVIKNGDGTSINHYRVLGSMATYGA